MLYSVVQSFPRWVYLSSSASNTQVTFVCTRIWQTIGGTTKTSHSLKWEVKWRPLLYASSIFFDSALRCHRLISQKSILGHQQNRKTLWDFRIRKILDVWFLNNVSKSLVYLISNCNLTLFLMVHVRMYAYIFFTCFSKEKTLLSLLYQKIYFFH